MGSYQGADFYQCYYHEHPYPGENMIAIHRESAAAVMSDPPTKVLDLGCGCGWFETELRKQGYAGEYRGVDFADFGIRMARLNCPLENPSVFSVGDLRTWEEGSYTEDAMIVCLETLEHVEDDIGILRRFARQGRRVLLSVPTYDAQAHVRIFSPEDNLLARYEIRGKQWYVAGQVYVLGVFA